MSEVTLTPDVGHAVCGVLPDLGPAEGELGLAFLRRGRVLRQELHDVRVVLVASHAAFADDVHDAGQHVAGAAAEAPRARRAGRFLFLARVQDLKGTNNELIMNLFFSGAENVTSVLWVVLENRLMRHSEPQEHIWCNIKSVNRGTTVPMML